MKHFKHLFSPLEVKGYLLKNRITMAPMLVGYGHIDGTVTDQTVEYYSKRAKGGASMVVVEATLVNLKGRTNLSQMRIDNNIYLPGLSRLALGIKNNGSVAVIQLQHSGRVANVDEPLSASERPVETPSGIKPMAMRKFDIQETIGSFTQAALRAKTAGFDMIELHGAFGHLLAQFLSPRTNKRDDEYGGNLENRMRFPLEVVDGIIETVGKDFPVGYQLLADELLSDGFKLEEAKIFAQQLAQRGIAYLTVTAGNFESCMLGDGLFAMRSPNENVVNFATEIKKAVKIPVFACGKIPDARSADKIISEGKADGVAIGRPLLADPDFPNKARKGEIEDIIHCIYCCGCIDRIERNLKALCDINPEVGQEGHSIVKTESPKKVWIIGGGPAGMSAALTSFKRGHKVTIFEKEEELGGKLKYASLLPGKKPVEAFLNYLKTQVVKSGITIRTEKEVTIDDIKTSKPDVLIIATGGKIKEVKVSGTENNKAVLSAVKVLTGEIKAGKNTVIVGGNANGCELAELIASQGNSVTILNNKEEFAEDMDLLNKAMLMQKLEEHKVILKPKTTLAKVNKKMALIDNENGEMDEIKFDSLIFVQPCEADYSLYINSREYIEDVFIIGDAWREGRLRHAVHSGYATGANI